MTPVQTHPDATQTEDTRDKAADSPKPADLRGEATVKRDRSQHRRHHWLYEDLLN